jgi:plastocyanin
MKKTFYTNHLVRKSLIVILIAASHYAVAAQGFDTVVVTNNKFTPVEITISAGDSIIWINAEGNHNVNGTLGTNPMNPASFGNTVGTGWVFSHVFTGEGTYEYQCDPHVRFGMVGKVIVEAALISAVEDYKVASALKVYPNPAINELTITSELGIESVSILNFAGQRILNTAGLGVTEQTLSIEAFTPGVYLIEVKTPDNKLQYSRFIKK